MKWIKKIATTPLDDKAQVVDSLDQITDNRTNAPSIRAVNERFGDIWEQIYPVGSIYLSVNAVDPSIMFGGTWVQIKDKFLLGAGDTFTNGSTGGEVTHTLTTTEIPQVQVQSAQTPLLAHSHGYTYTEMPQTIEITYAEKPFSEGGKVAHAYTASATPQTISTSTEVAGNNEGTVPPYVTHSHGVSVAEEAATPSNNMPPYLTVNVWTRTA